MTKDEKRYMADAASLGCIACRLSWYGHTPAELHHPRSGQGMSQRASNMNVIPLCPQHHRGTMHPQVASIHMDKARFEALFGTEAELVGRTRADVEELRSNIVGGAA